MPPTSDCLCSVCASLRSVRRSGIDELEPAAILEIALQLPIVVREVLEAQTRIRKMSANSSDYAVVREAARRCTADRFKGDL